MEKEEAQKEFWRNIIIGSVLRSLRRQQGMMSYLIHGGGTLSAESG